jgi:hypothetical protein
MLATMSERESADLGHDVTSTRIDWQVWVSAGQGSTGQEIELSQANLPALIAMLIRAHAARRPKRLDDLYIALSQALDVAAYDPAAGRLTVDLTYP